MEVVGKSELLCELFLALCYYDIEKTLKSIPFSRVDSKKISPKLKNTPVIVPLQVFFAVIGFFFFESCNSFFERLL